MFLAASLEGCPAGSWPMPALKQNQHLLQKLLARRKHPLRAAPSPSLLRNPPSTMSKLLEMTQI